MGLGKNFLQEKCVDSGSTNHCNWGSATMTSLMQIPTKEGEDSFVYLCFCLFSGFIGVQVFSQLFCAGSLLRQLLLLLQSSGSRAQQSSVVPAPSLQNTAPVVVGHMFSCSETCGILHRRIEHVSPSLAGRFLNHCATSEAPILPLMLVKRA